eukprot:1784363-Prymnesium_polylepis.1
MACISSMSLPQSPNTASTRAVMWRVRQSRHVRRAHARAPFPNMACALITWRSCGVPNRICTAGTPRSCASSCSPSSSPPPPSVRRVMSN